MSSRIRELEDQVEDSKLAREALEKEIQEFKEKKEPEAARIRKRLTEDLWPAALAEYDKLKRIHGELQPVLEKVTGLNNEMAALAGRHENLIAESVSTPQILIPRELYFVANMKLEPLPKTFDARLTSEGEEQRLADLLKEQRPVVNKILERAGEKWPTCPACGSLMLAQRRGPNDPAYGINADSSKGFANFRCPKHSQWTKDVVFPARPMAEMMIGIKGPSSLPSAVADLPPNASHGLAQPGLTDQNAGGEKTT